MAEIKTTRRAIGSKKRQATPEEKRERIIQNSKEWEEIDYFFTVDYCFNLFMVDRQARGSTKPTLDAYKRMYDRLDAHLIQLAGGNGVKGDGGKNTPVKWLVQDGALLFFIKSLGNVSQQTINHYLRHYRAFGNFCEAEGYIEGFKCPIKEVEPPIKQVYTDAELKALLKRPNKDDFIEFRDYCIVSLILATGARSHTIRDLKIADVDLVEGYINFNTIKTHKVVRLGLEKKLRGDLMEFIAQYRSYDLYGEEISMDAYLFCNQYGEQLSPRGLINTIANYNKRRGVLKTGIHLLRHTFAKNWITSGGDIISLAKVLTHSELEMVKKYSNLYADDIKEEMEQHSTISQMRRNSGKTIRNK